MKFLFFKLYKIIKIICENIIKIVKGWMSKVKIETIRKVIIRGKFLDFEIKHLKNKKILRPLKKNIVAYGLVSAE